VLYQIAAVAGVAAAEGTRIRHVKPHGALYNMATHDRELAGAIVRACAEFDRSLIVVGLPGSALLEEARRRGLSVATEGFVDRGYEPAGSLTPRSRPGSVIHDVEVATARAVRMALQGDVIARDGSVVQIHPDTLCIHGDTPGADVIAAAVRKALEHAGLKVRAFAGADPR
jgi:UPF0271 protein